MLNKVWNDSPCESMPQQVDDSVVLPTPKIDSTSYGDVGVTANSSRSFSMSGMHHRFPVVVVCSLDLLRILDALSYDIGGVHIGALDREKAQASKNATTALRAMVNFALQRCISGQAHKELARQFAADAAEVESVTDAAKIDDDDPFVTELDPTLIGEGTYLQRKFASSGSRAALYNVLQLIKAGVNQEQYGMSPDHQSECSAPDYAAEAEALVNILAQLDPKIDSAPVTHLVIRKLLPLILGKVEFAADGEGVLTPAHAESATESDRAWSEYWLSVIDTRILALYLRYTNHTDRDAPLSFRTTAGGDAILSESFFSETGKAAARASEVDEPAGREVLSLLEDSDLEEVYAGADFGSRPSWIDVVDTPADVTAEEERSPGVSGVDSNTDQRLVIKEGAEARIALPAYADSYPAAASLGIAPQLVPWADYSTEEQDASTPLTQFKPTYQAAESSDITHLSGAGREIKLGTVEILPNIAGDRSGPYLRRGAYAAAALAKLTSENSIVQGLRSNVVGYWLSKCNTFNCTSAGSLYATDSAPISGGFSDSVSSIALPDSMTALVKPAAMGPIWAKFRTDDSPLPATDATFKYRYEQHPDDPEHTAAIYSAVPLRVQLLVYRNAGTVDDPNYQFVDGGVFDLSQWAYLAVSDVEEAKKITDDSVEYGSKDQAKGPAQYQNADDETDKWWEKLWNWIKKNWILILAIILLILLMRNNNNSGGSQTVVVLPRGEDEGKQVTNAQNAVESERPNQQQTAAGTAPGQGDWNQL